jgi:hypothetical protein
MQPHTARRNSLNGISKVPRYKALEMEMAYPKILQNPMVKLIISFPRQIAIFRWHTKFSDTPDCEHLAHAGCGWHNVHINQKSSYIKIGRG